MGNDSQNTLTMPKFQFYRGPITNIRSAGTMTILDAYHYITSMEACQRTMELREIKDEKEHRAYKGRHFDYVLFSGLASILTAIATTLGVTSCMGY